MAGQAQPAFADGLKVRVVQFEVVQDLSYLQTADRAGFYALGENCAPAVADMFGLDLYPSK